MKILSITYGHPKGHTWRSKTHFVEYEINGKTHEVMIPKDVAAYIAEKENITIRILPVSYI